MNIGRKLIEVELDGRKLSMVLDFESAITYQENTGESIFKGVERIGNDLDAIVFANLLAAVLKDEEGNSVGLDFVKKLNLMEAIGILTEKMGELIDNALPVADPKKNKK